MIVCGWYTPDYAHYLPALRESLDSLGHAHDFVCVAKDVGGWEKNTLRKAHHLLAAMKRHSDDTIIFLDVDCEVRSSLTPLALAAEDCDAVLYFRSRLRTCGALKLSVRSGTIAIRNTATSRRFVRLWGALSDSAPCGAVDQTTLPVAMASTPGLRVGVMDPRFCAVPADAVPHPVILHDSASRSQPKMSTLKKRILAYVYH